jgi:hypothetical protein
VPSPKFDKNILPEKHLDYRGDHLGVVELASMSGNAFTAVARKTTGDCAMDAKELILEIFREADFISETLSQKTPEGPSNFSPELLSASAIKKACGAFLNGQDPTTHVDGFQRKELELNSCEEMEIWGKFTPPPQFITYENES